MENARRFLARVVPWPTAHDNWWISIHPAYVHEGRRGMGLGQAFKDLDAAIRYIEWLRDKPGSDMYVCMSGQAVVVEKHNRKARIFHQAERRSDNAMAFRAVWFDVDVKLTGFPTTDAAFEAFAHFLGKSGLPPPTFIVMSGSGGFHVYWVFDDPIS